MRWDTKQSICCSASSLYMFRMSTTPTSVVHKTVTTASGTGHIFCATTSLQRGKASLATLEGGSGVPDAVVEVLCTPDDGCG